MTTTKEMIKNAAGSCCSSRSSNCCCCDNGELTSDQLPVLGLIPLTVTDSCAGDIEFRYQSDLDELLSMQVNLKSYAISKYSFDRQQRRLKLRPSRCCFLYFCQSILWISVAVHQWYSYPTLCQAFFGTFPNRYNIPKKQLPVSIVSKDALCTSHRTTTLRRNSMMDESSSQRFDMNDKSTGTTGSTGSNSDATSTNIDNYKNFNSVHELDGTNSDRRILPPSTTSIWERMAFYCIVRQYRIPPTDSANNENDIRRFVTTIATPEQLYDYAQYISVLRVVVPSIGYATIAKLVYPFIAMWIVSLLQGESGIFAVVSQDASQYIQNICTTSGLVFSILIGQTYYFMYQQQEKIYYAIYDEVAMAKMVLEQISLISRGRTQLYETILQQMNRYVQDDLQQLNDIDPAIMLSSRPCDDPLEDILYLTSVGEPSQIYQSIRSLRQARAQRLGSLQKKLPEIQMTLLWILAAIVLLVFPLLGAGSQTIGGTAILQVQAWYMSFLVFGISLVMGVIYELRSPNQPGAYNARTVLSIMISGLQEELQQRLQYSSSSSSLSNDTTSNTTFTTNFVYFDAGPSIDNE